MPGRAERKENFRWKFLAKSQPAGKVVWVDGLWLKAPYLLQLLPYRDLEE